MREYAERGRALIRNPAPTPEPTFVIREATGGVVRDLSIRSNNSFHVETPRRRAEPRQGEAAGVGAGIGLAALAS